MTTTRRKVLVPLATLVAAGAVAVGLGGHLHLQHRQHDLHW